MIEDEVLETGKPPRAKCIRPYRRLMSEAGSAAVCAILTSMLLSFPTFSPAFAQEDTSATQAVISPLRIEEAKLQASPDSVRYYVVKAVFSQTTLTETTFRHMTEDDKNKITSDAFYLASLRLAANETWPADIVGILNDVRVNNSPRSTLLRLEEAYHKETGEWPDLVAVDVDSITERIQGSMRIQ